MSKRQFAGHGAARPAYQAKAAQLKALGISLKEAARPSRPNGKIRY
jgi:hypothetical protein